MVPGAEMKMEQLMQAIYIGLLLVSNYQWGSFNITSNVETKWPITFPNACYVAVCSTTPLTAEGGDSIIVSKTGFTTDVYFDNHNQCFCIGIGS